MKLVTYLGPSDARRLRARGRTLLIERGIPLEVSNETAAIAERQCGSRVVVSDLETSQPEGEGPPTEGEDDDS